MGFSINCTVFVVLIIAAMANGLSKSEYGKWFEGEGTYYEGGEGKWQSGNCALRAPRPQWFYNYVPVAMNNEQYLGSCGACLEVVGSGKGLGANPITGTFKAIVIDRCPECKLGDIDLARDGDGRWDVKWRVIPCDAEQGIEFQFEGSNPYYHKVQPRSLKSPPTKVTIGGINAEFKQDNHWVAQNGGGFETPTKIEVWTVLGDHITAYVNSHSSGVVKPTKVEGGEGGSKSSGDDDSNSNDDKANGNGGSESKVTVTPRPTPTRTPTPTPTPAPKSKPPVSNVQCQGQYSYCGYGQPWGGVSNACCASGTTCMEYFVSGYYFCVPN